jgi:hypothetical protein
MAYDAPDVKTIKLFLEQYQISHVVDWPFAERPRFDARESLIYPGALMLRAIQDVLIQRECVAEYTPTWWDAVKDRFAPRWFLARWPARKMRIDMHVLYPKIALPKQPHSIKLRTWDATDRAELPPYSSDE